MLKQLPGAKPFYTTYAACHIVTEATDEIALLKDLAGALGDLASAPRSRFETTLLIHPHVLGNFLDYNNFLGVAEQLVGKLGLRGTIQIASFHPNHQFAGTDPSALENYTNRAPYPMLHLLREESISEVASDRTDLLEIPRRNIETLRGLGREKILEKLKAIEDGKGDPWPSHRLPA